MSNSLFLDPFQDSSTVTGSDAHAAAEVPGERVGTADVVPGTVVDSAAAADRTDGAVSASTPLDLVDAVGAFLDDTHLWWPRELKATDREGHVFFGEGMVLEEGTEGGMHRWATVLSVSDAALELDWLGGAPAPIGAVSASDQGSRVYLAWAAGTSGGAEITARGAASEQWSEEWTAILGAFARFTGGRFLDGSVIPAATADSATTDGTADAARGETRS